MLALTRRSRLPLGVALAVSLLAALTFSAVTASASGVTSGRIDDAEDCLEAAPEQVSIAGVTDHGKEVVLDVHLLLDGVSEQRAGEIIDIAQRAYTPLKITLRPTYQMIDVPAQKTASEFITSAPEPSSDSQYLFAAAKKAVGGTRPPNIDVVYLLTSDKITGGTAGQADCIGGIRYPARAFAIGEEDSTDRGPGTVALCCTWTTAKIAAHEIAHLLGAHHHYSNCVEGAAAVLDERQASTCTVMINDVGLVNLHFSTLEAAAVRGHAVKYAERPQESAPQPQPSSSPTPRPTPSSSASPTPQPSSSPTAEPEPSPSSAPDPVTYTRNVSLDLARHLVARGVVDAGDATGCSSVVRVYIERRARGLWTRVAATDTSPNGTFRLRLPDRRGTYRAVVDEMDGVDGDRSFTCAAAASALKTHRHR